MNKVIYEKPQMTIVSLRNESAVAKNCWHNAANDEGKKWYYDYNEGSLGYLEFEVAGECSGGGTIFNVQYLPDTVGRTEEAVNAENYLNAGLKNDIKFSFTDVITDDPGQVS